MRIILSLFFVVTIYEFIYCIPAATNPKYFSVYDSGSVQPKTWPFDSVQSDSVGFADSSSVSGIADTALNSPDHNVDTAFIPVSNGYSLWNNSVLKSNDDGSPGGIASLTLPYNRVYYFKIPNDTAELHIGAEGYGGAYLNLYGQYSCCDGSFYLSGPGGGLSEIWAHNLKLNSDSSIYSVSSKINRLASDSLIQLNFDTLKLMANGDHAARIKFGGVGYQSVIPAISMTDSIPLLQGNGLLGRISGSSFRVGIGALALHDKADSSVLADSVKCGWIETPCSLFDGSTYRATGTSHIYKMGKIIRIDIPQLTGTITAATTTYIRFPPGILIAPPGGNEKNPVPLTDMAVGEGLGWVGYNDATSLILYSSVIGVLGNGTKGILQCQVEWAHE